MTSLDEKTRQSALQYAHRLTEIKQLFVDRDEVIDLLGIGALCQEHVLVIGPPGTAKTRLLNRFCQMLDTTAFSYLLTRFTEPAEIFGPIDVKLFQENSVYEVKTAGMLPEARVAFLDEVFQGSSAILNTLLTLINERTFHNGRTTVTTPLITLVGSSNEIPDDPVLAAFSDRFLLRCTLGYVSDDQIEEVLQLGWAAEQALIYAAGSNGAGRAARWSPADERNFVPVSPHELSTLQQAVARIDLSEVMLPYVRIIQALRAEGISFSDRRAVRAQKVFAASALMAGRGEARVTDLARIVHLWTDLRDEPSLRRIVADHGVPVEEAGGSIREVDEILEIDLHDITLKRARVTTEQEFRDLMRRTQRLAAELRRDHPGEQEALDRVQHEQRETVALYRERFPEKGLD
jgi:MoxR-like ATPase